MKVLRTFIARWPQCSLTTRHVRLALTESYVDRELHGPFTKFYSTGAKQLEGAYHSGKRVGRWVEYHPDGSVKSVQEHSVPPDADQDPPTNGREERGAPQGR